jgi:hypothetical protein
VPLYLEYKLSVKVSKAEHTGSYYRTSFIVLAIYTYISGIRFLHRKLFLYKPMLARFCVSQPQNTTDPALELGLGGHILSECAHLCIGIAQKMIELVHENDKLDGTIGIITW